MAVGDSVDPAAWGRLFDEVMRPVEGRFVRPEPRRTVREFVTGLLSSAERKNGWWLAEQAGHARPDAMQRLLSAAVWDADAVRDDVRALVSERLGHPDGVLIGDETGVVKKGTASVGVQRQYTGTAGRIENSQVAVFLCYASPRGRALIDRRLYLPTQSWCADPDRRRAAGVPEEVTFAAKPELVAQMTGAALDAGVPARWVTADEVYGNHRALRAELRDRRVGYVLAVRCDIHVTGPAGRCRADALVARLPDQAWQPASAGAGAKGPRGYDWAWIDLAAGTDDRWLLVRRQPRTGEHAYYLCWADRPQPLATLIRVAGHRGAIEEAFQAAKSQIGLDHYQVRRWTSWHRYITLVMVALAFLAIAISQTAPTRLARPARPPGSPPDRRRLVPLTLAELRHLLASLLLRPALDAAHLLTWSRWRRQHQARARRCHYQHRLTTR